MTLPSESEITFDQVIECCINSLDSAPRQVALEKMKSRFPIWVSDIEEFFRNLTVVEEHIQNVANDI